MNRWEIEVQKSLLDSEEAAIKELEKQYAKALKDVSERVKLFQADIDLLDQALSQDGLDDTTRALLQSQKRSKVYQQNYQKALQGQVGGILDKMHGDNYATIEKYLNGCYETGYIGTMYSIAGQGIPLVVPINQAAAVKAVLTDSKVSNGLYNALGVNVKKLKKSITQEISRGIASSLPYSDIARNISSVSSAPLSRAKTIARTEGHRIQQTSSRDAQEAAKKKGADVLKQWDAALDARTRDSHARVDGEIRELDEKFSNGLMFPGDPNGGAAEVVNCRCTSNTRARWALDDEELNTLKERAEYFGLDKTANFEDYKKKYLQAAETQKQEAADFSSIKDFEGLEKWLKSNYNVNMDKSVTVLDFESIKEGVQGIDIVLKEFPQAKGSFVKLSTKKSGIMCANYSGEINFNPVYYADRKKAVYASQSTGFHPKGNNVVSSASHEAGHILEKALIDKNGSSPFGLIAWSDCTYAKAVVSDACKAAKKTAEGKGKRNAQLKGEISGYAKTNDSECLAEAVADYTLNGANAATLSKEIWKILKGELG